MMLKKVYLLHKVIAVGIAATILVGCSSEKQSETISDAESTENAVIQEADDDTKTQDFLKSLPSPIHVARIFQRAGLKYLSGITNPAANATKYQSPYSKSINLGIYTTDLAYCTFNDQSQEAVTYFKAVKTLTDGLNMTSIFESTNLIPRFEKNIGNKDSLVSLMATLSMESDILLKQTSRLDVAYLSFSGAWIESMYIATQMLKNKRNPEIMQRVMDQSNSLGKLIALLEDFQQNKEFEALIVNLKDLKTNLDNLNNENSGNQEEEFKTLTAKVEALRKKVVSDI